MANPNRGPNSRATGPDDADPMARPQIWVEGRQQPRFNFRAWAGVSLTMTRRRLAPALSAGAARVEAYGRSVLRGERIPNLAWTGRAQKFIPSHESVGGFIAATGRFLADAREVVLPLPKPAEPIAYPNLIRPDFSSRPHRQAFAAAPEQPPAATEPALSAIRSLIDDAGDDAPARPARESVLPELARPEPAPPTATEQIGGVLGKLAWGAGAHVFAWGLTALAFPLGGFHATLFHLEGGDLRDWS
jgi:hypothetical protein